MAISNRNTSTIKPNFSLKKFGLIALLSILSFNLFAYNIRLEIENCPSYYIYLGMHKGPDFEVIDSIVAVNGIVEFKAQKTLPHGVYFIVIPPQSRFDFIIADQQNITIKTDVQNVLGKLQISGENQYYQFIELQKELAKLNLQRTQLNMELQFYNSFQKDTVKDINLRLENLNLQQSKLYTKYKNTVDSTTLFYKILNILEPFQVPANIEAIRYEDPLAHYRYYVDHYLDRVDFTDESLLNTPEFVFHKLLMDYCFYFFDTRVNNINDIYPDLDNLISKTENNLEYRRYVINYLISRYEKPSDLKLEALLVYVFRNYFLVNKPSWVSDQTFAIMKFRIEALQNNVVGEYAKDLNLPDIEGEYHSIYGLSSRYKVLLFWDPECDICVETAQKLMIDYEKLQAENIEVYAVYTETNKELWNSNVLENQYSWINVYDPDLSSNFGNYYGTYKTPRIFILDEDNKILTKDILPESVYPYIKEYERRFKDKENQFQFLFSE